MCRGPQLAAFGLTAAVALAASVAGAGCGRLGFDGVGGPGPGDGGQGGDGGVDGSADAPGPWQTPELVGVDVLGGPGGQVGTAVSLGPARTMLVVGYASAGTLVVPGLATQAGGSGANAFAVHYGSNGPDWVSEAVGGGDEQLWDVATDAAGNFYGCGSYGAAGVVFGSVSVAAVGQAVDGFVVSWAADGAVRWLRGFGGAGDDFCFGVAVGPDPDAGAEVVYVTGWITGSATLGGLSAATAGGQDILLARLDRAGTPLSFSAVGGPGGADQGKGLAVGPGGLVGVVGQFSDTVDVPGGPLVASGGLDGLVFSPGYTGPRPAYQLSGAGTERMSAVDVDSAGRLAAVGAFDGPARVPPDPLIGSGGGREGFVSVRAGGTVAYDTFGGVADDEASGVAFVGAGRRIVAGRYTHVASASGQVLGTAVPDRGTGADGLVLAQDASGQLLWHEFLGGATFDVATDVASGGGDFVVLGEFASDFVLGGVPLTPTGSDVMIVRYRLP
ncbi:MAG: hypothetical protein KA297_19025 [Kofleriaceae bacterium]|nr:hypothetical protein [Kofleriaceae bacterium]